MKLRFAGGTEEEADAVVGCDGIKSVVRRIIVGEDHPSARPQYSHKYAYRGLIPMDKAVEALGEERAGNACMYVCLLFLFTAVESGLSWKRWVGDNR